MRQIRRIFPLTAALVFAGTACTTLPDVRPFADSTAALAASAGAHYHDVSNDLGSLAAPRIPGEREDDAAFLQRKKSIQDAKATFAMADKNLDTLFDAMTTYSERLASLAAAGKTGPEAAQSLLDSAKGFGDLAGVVVPVAGPTAEAIAKGFKAIADEFTKVQAKKSLLEAADGAQSAVDLVAKQFEVIYGEALKQATDGIRNFRLLQAQIDTGPNIIGFNANVKRNYNAYYQYLNQYVTESAVEEPAAAWRGFCGQKTGPCRAREELESVGIVEARMTAIHPIVAAYEVQASAIDDTLSRRRKASAAVIRAVKVWALEHEKLRASLRNGASLNAFNLRSAIVELQGILVQK